MKTDNYLNLCLDQAARSPLRYRHGYIIVRGGKVIGQGYNDYRTGFDGGALKIGAMFLRSLDGPALAKLKKKHAIERGQNLELATESTKTFTPFEMTTRGGKLVNTPLSMHSEMMAIQSALSAANCTASSAMYSQKPCFKLSGDSKRKARLRREAIQLYVETVCKQYIAEQRSGKPQVQQWQFEQSAPGSGCTKACVSRGGEGECVVVFEEQYGETPNEEREEESSSSLQHWQQVPTWKTRSQPLTAWI